MKQYINPMLGMNSSKNVYPIINDNYSSIIGENGNANNIYYVPINQILIK